MTSEWVQTAYKNYESTKQNTAPAVCEGGAGQKGASVSESADGFATRKDANTASPKATASQERKATWELLQEPCPIVDQAMKNVANKYSHQPVAASPEAGDEAAELSRIKELEIFIWQMYEAFRSKRIRDFDTGWRMTERVMPINLECLHAKDVAETTSAYRKVHLSDILLAARKLVDLYHNYTPHTPPSDEEVEQVARAIGDVWDCPEEDDDRLRVYAKAAIAAMKQPTEGKI